MYLDVLKMNGWQCCLAGCVLLSVGLFNFYVMPSKCCTGETKGEMHGANIPFAQRIRQLIEHWTYWLQIKCDSHIYLPPRQPYLLARSLVLGVQWLVKENQASLTQISIKHTAASARWLHGEFLVYCTWYNLPPQYSSKIHGGPVLCSMCVSSSSLASIHSPVLALHASDNDLDNLIWVSVFSLLLW